MGPASPVRVDWRFQQSSAGSSAVSRRKSKARRGPGPGAPRWHPPQGLAPINWARSSFLHRQTTRCRVRPFDVPRSPATASRLAVESWQVLLWVDCLSTRTTADRHSTLVALVLRNCPEVAGRSLHCGPSRGWARQPAMGRRQLSAAKQISIPDTGRSDRTAPQPAFATCGNRPGTCSRVRAIECRQSGEDRPFTEFTWLVAPDPIVSGRERRSERQESARQRPFEDRNPSTAPGHHSCTSLKPVDR